MDCTISSLQLRRYWCYLRRNVFWHKICFDVAWKQGRNR